jgi:DNA-binding PadR family transcriptional regulator
LYRYLRYCLEVGLLELDHIRQNGFLPAKFYRLTTKGHAFLELFKNLVKIAEMGG